MKQKTRIYMSISFGLLTAIALGGFLYQTATASERAKTQLFNRFGGMTTQVLVANKTIRPGEKITESSLVSQEWPSILLPADPVLRSESNKVVGKHANTIILTGEPLRTERIDEAASVLESVPVGMQAITIPTDPIRAIGGQVRVGMQVDLLCPNMAGVMEVLARDVTVLALSTDDTISEENIPSGILGGRASQEIRWITLSIDNELAQQVVTAATAGKVYLTYSGRAYDG